MLRQRLDDALFAANIPSTVLRLSCHVDAIEIELRTSVLWHVVVHDGFGGGGEEAQVWRGNSGC
jgi:hypothetical protein